MNSGLSIGVSDFRKLRGAGALFVDKSRFIIDVVTDPAEVILLPRPRRFGKTLNLSMLRTWLDRGGDDVAPLFEGLAITSAGDAAWHHFQRYPVLWLTLKDVKDGSWEQCFASLRALLADLVAGFSELLEAAPLQPQDRAFFQAVQEETADESACARVLKQLTRAVHLATGEHAVVLIDEYDTPIHAGLEHGYYDDVVRFARVLMSGGLKDNPHVFKGVLTGVLRVAKESVFSGLNNLAVYSLLRPEYRTAFGFTPEEVGTLARDYGAEEALPDLERWYNGYVFGGQTVYNPWSVLSFLASEDRLFRPYWVSTGSDEVLRRVLAERASLSTAEVTALLAGESVDRVLDEGISLRDLDRHPDAAWSFLVFSGYLRAQGPVGEQDGCLVYRLTAPNREVASLYRALFRSWLHDAGGPGALDAVAGAVLAGDSATLEAALRPLLVRTFAHLDLGGRLPERVYQAFVVGLLLHLGQTHEILSNPEAGYGRADVLVLPREAGHAGAVMELKVLTSRQNADAVLDASFAQMEARDYAQRLRDAGADPIHHIALAFDGKQVWARTR